MNKIIGILVFATMFMIAPASAAVDFSDLTDLVNATMTVINAFVENGSTLVGFIVLVVELALVTVIGSFISMILMKIIKKLDNKMN